ncbi:MAG: sigma-70 family RNA polymerase sigma factor [Dehalococcoidia bacterium]
MEEALALLERAKAGDRDAFAALAEEHRASLHRLCFKMTGSREDAEDLVQETLLKAYLGIEKFEMRSSLSTWLHRIATNLCIDHQRHRPPWREERRWQWFQDNPDLVPQIAQTLYLSPEFAVEAKEVAATCVNCMTMTLPVKQRLAMVLCDQLGFSREDASKAMNASVASVKTELHRGRKKMTDIYERRCALVDQKNECNACIVAGIGERERKRRKKQR